MNFAKQKCCWTEEGRWMKTPLSFHGIISGPVVKELFFARFSTVKKNVLFKSVNKMSFRFNLIVLMPTREENWSWYTTVQIYLLVVLFGNLPTVTENQRVLGDCDVPHLMRKFSLKLASFMELYWSLLHTPTTKTLHQLLSWSQKPTCIDLFPKIPPQNPKLFLSQLWSGLVDGK